MTDYTEKEIIEGINHHDSKILLYVYREFFPYVETYIHQHGGNSDQAKDVFQEGMIILYKKIEAGNFSLICKVSTYLYAVCKKIWIQEHKKMAQRHQKMNEGMLVQEPEILYGDQSTSEIRNIFNRNFQSLSKECQQVLMLYFNDVRNEEIRKEMGFTSVHQVVDRKYRCKKTLITRIKNDPNFSKFKDGKHT